MQYICADAARTYGQHSLPDELRNSLAETLSVDVRQFGIKVRETLFGHGSYRWPLSPDQFILTDEFTERLSEFYTAISEKSYPASLLISIERAIVARNVIYCSNGTERRTLYETARANDRAAIELPPAEELERSDKKTFSDPRWNCFYLGSAGSSNYGHWLVDDLPRVKAAASLMQEKKPLRILIPGYDSPIDQVRIDSIRNLLRAPVHVDLVNPQKSYFLSNLFYATPVSDHPISKSPLAMDYAARETISSLYQGRKVRMDGQVLHIYIRRSQGYGRNLQNEDALTSLLSEKGFLIIDVDAMTFEQQARIFAQASIVIGTMGAAMANTLFCRPHTQILYLAPKGWIEPFYLDLAAVRGHQYYVLYGEVPDTDIPPHLSDFTIPIDSVLSALPRL